VADAATIPMPDPVAPPALAVTRPTHVAFGGLRGSSRSMRETFPCLPLPSVPPRLPCLRRPLQSQGRNRLLLLRPGLPHRRGRHRSSRPTSSRLPRPRPRPSNAPRAATAGRPTTAAAATSRARRRLTTARAAAGRAR
jgi:hypothetical protein